MCNKYQIIVCGQFIQLMKFEIVLHTTQHNQHAGQSGLYVAYQTLVAIAKGFQIFKMSECTLKMLIRVTGT